VPVKRPPGKFAGMVSGAPRLTMSRHPGVTMAGHAVRRCSTTRSRRFGSTAPMRSPSFTCSVVSRPIVRPSRATSISETPSTPDVEPSRCWSDKGIASRLNPRHDPYFLSKVA
jgi:hypothetical protein